MTGMDLASARLVPAGDGGWLARLPGAIVFVPDDGEEAREMISACLACDGALELLGGVGSRLADPRATPWPPFVLVAARGAELVAVVHGPVEVVVERAGENERLYGGDEVGSWLNKALPQVQALHTGAGPWRTGPWTCARAWSGRPASCWCPGTILPPGQGKTAPWRRRA